MFQVIRSVILLSVLILLPITAVCWNKIPKDIFQKKEKVKVETDSVIQNNHGNLTDHELNGKSGFTQISSSGKNAQSDKSESVWLTSSIPLSSDPLINPASSNDSDANKDHANAARANANIFTNNRTINPESQTTPNRTSDDSGLVRIMPMTPLPSRENSSTAQTQRNGIIANNTTNTANAINAQRNFSDIEKELQQLGATYYWLEKWGDQGELFRFRCYVNPHGNSVVADNQPNSNKYQKYFQHIDNDQIRVMEHVIDEIKKWKGMQ
ncbi:MAG: hypothetical protein LBB88_10745 [Planctomycetaceae bacterium]|jgi:hypothetical protein|nr:hypothetical protein [Planctomycetaceae bacterium]